MKKLYTLVLALVVAISASAQSTGKNGSGSNSTGQRSVYKSTNSSSSSQSHSRTATYESKSVSKSAGVSEKSGTQTHHSTNESVAVKKKVNLKKESVTIDQENNNENAIHSIKKTNAVSKESFKDEKGGITKVNREPDYPMYEEKEKGKHEVDYSQPSTAVDHDQNNSSIEAKDSVDYGLSATTTTFHNNGIRRNGVIVTCDEMRASRERRLNVVSAYEQYDLSQIKRCYDNYPVEDRWLISCDEFERSTFERKYHIANNPQFYNLTAIQNCDSYTEFMKSFTPETEE